MLSTLLVKREDLKGHWKTVRETSVHCESLRTQGLKANSVGTYKLQFCKLIQASDVWNNTEPGTGRIVVEPELSRWDFGRWSEIAYDGELVEGIFAASDQ